MKRLTEYTIPETGFTVVPEEKYKRILMDEKPSVEKVYNRLKKIEDILGDEYDLDRLRELAQADREGRVRIIAGPKPREAVCGNCGNFIRNPGTRTGVCRVQSFYRDQHGKEEPRRGIFSPSQSRKACRKFVRAEEALRREQE